MSNRNLGRWATVTLLIGFLGLAGALPAHAARPSGPNTLWDWLSRLWNAAPSEALPHAVSATARRAAARPAMPNKGGICIDPDGNPVSPSQGGSVSCSAATSGTEPGPGTGL